MSFARCLLVCCFVGATLCCAKIFNKNVNVKYMKENVDTDLKVICGVSTFGLNLHGKGKFLLENIKVDLCTHIVYGPVMIENNVLIPYVNEDETTTEDETVNFEMITNLKKTNPELKILLAVGGMKQDPEEFWKIVTEHDLMIKFIDETITFLKKYDFDGLSFIMTGIDEKLIDTMETGHTTKSFKKLWTKFLMELGNKFTKETLLLTTTVPSEKELIDEFYDVHKISKIVDLIFVKGFDLHNKDLMKTVVHNPLFAGHSDIGVKSTNNVEWVINYLIKNGVPVNKMILNVALFGRSFTLKDPTNHVLGATVTGLGKPGTYTKVKGLLSYYEMCVNIEHGWKMVYEKTMKGVYAFKGNQWVSFTDVKIISDYCELVKTKNLGGLGLVTIDMDDFTGHFCNKGKFPLLTKVNEILKSKMIEEEEE